MIMEAAFHLMAMQGDTAKPAGKYLIALNKLAIDRFAQRIVEGLARREGLVVHHRGGQAHLPRQGQPLGVGPVADHGGDAGRSR